MHFFLYAYTFVDAPMYLYIRIVFSF